MAKGVSATNLIVSLAVGLIVIVGLGYLVWTWLGRGEGNVKKQYCNGQKLAYCTQLAARNYPTDIADQPGGGWSEFSPDCKNVVTASIDECKTLLKP